MSSNDEDLYLQSEKWSKFISIVPHNMAQLAKCCSVEEIYCLLFRNYLSSSEEKEESLRPNASFLYGTPVREVGNGNFGKVYQWQKADRLSYAVKVLTINKDRNSKKQCYRVFREFMTCYNLTHNCIAKSWDILVGPSLDEIVLIQDFVEGINLKEALNSLQLFELQKFCDAVFKKILLLVKYLHDEGIGHNDLKPANIILNLQTFDIKIVDFGLSCFLNEFLDFESEHTLLKSGTSRYLPPELHNFSLNGYHNDFSVKRLVKAKETWSLGLIYFNIISRGNNLWLVGHKSDDAFNEYVRHNFITKFHSIAGLSELQTDGHESNIAMSRSDTFYKMLALKNKERPFADRILETPWIKSINEEDIIHNFID